MNFSERHVQRGNRLRWQLVLPMWAGLAVATFTYFAGASQMADECTREAVWQNVTAHASHLAGDLSEDPGSQELSQLKAKLSRAISSSDLLAIAVYQPIEALGTMRRLVVQSASDSTLTHFPLTIDMPTDWVAFERPDSTPIGDIYVATSLSVAKGRVKAAVRVATPMARAAQMVEVYQAWGAVLALIFMIMTYYLGDRIAQRFGGQFDNTRAQIDQLLQGDYALDLPSAPTPEFEQLHHRLRSLASKLAQAAAAAETNASGLAELPDVATAEEIRVLQTRLEERSRMLDEAYVEMETLDRAKDTFLSNLSHEMRTPLTSIIAAEEILTEFTDDDPDARARFLAIIYSESQRLLVLIDELLDLAKIEAKAMQLNFKEVDICLLTDQIAAQVFAQTHDKKVALSITKPTEAVRCECDPDRMGRIVRGMVENAFQASPDLGTVRIEVLRVGPWARIVVEDDTPFSMERSSDVLGACNPSSHDNMTSAAPFGTAIVEKLTKAHGGTLTQGLSKSNGRVVELSLPVHGVGVLAQENPELSTIPTVGQRNA